VPSLRSRLRSRRGWSIRQCGLLLSGHDWVFLRGDAWPLDELPDTELATALQQMLACWTELGEDGIRERCDGLHHAEPAWFGQYASQDGIERLYQEIMTDPLREWRLRVYPQHPVAGVVVADDE